MKKTILTLLLILPLLSLAQFTKTQGGTGISTAASGTLLMSTANTLRYTAISTTTLYSLLGISNTSTTTWGGIIGTLSNQTDLQNALNLKANSASPTFTGTVVLPSTTSVGTVSNIEIGYLDGVTSLIQTQLDSKGTFTLPSLTSGSVLFSNGSTLAQDNANFFWDDANNKLGIGTTSPQHFLHINGDQSGGVALFERFNAATAVAAGVVKIKARSTGNMTDGFGGALQFYIQDNAGIENAIADIRAIRTGADDTGDLTFHTAAAGVTSEKMRVTSAGNVGIGISPGATKLYVNGTGYFAGALAAGSDLSVFGTSYLYNPLYAFNGSNDYFGFVSTGGTNKLFTTAASTNKDITFSPGDVAAMTLQTTTGSVGVGTTSPVATFSVTGKAGVNPFTIASSTGSPLLNIDQLGRINVGTTTSVSGRKIHISGDSSAEGAVGIRLSDVATGGASFSFANGSSALSTFSFRSDTTGIQIMNLTSSGAIGIGTTTPNARVHIYGAAGTTVPLFAVASSSFANLFSINGGGHIVTGGGTPAVSSCGTSPTISGNDTSGTVTVGSGVVTTCVITFARARTNTPRVVGVITGGGLNITGGYSAKSTTAVTFSFAATVAAGTFDYYIVE